MRNLISFMHLSLDGFVCGPNGEMDWIKVDDTIFGHVEKRIGETDTALYGRVTYEMMEGYWPTAADKPNASRHDVEHSKWYKNAHKIVLSNTMADGNKDNTNIITGENLQSINDIKQQPGKEILLFGSPTATHSLAQLHLIDGYWLFVNPVVLGRGIPLFKDVKEQMKLQLLSTQQFPCGVTALDYLVAK